MEHSAYATWSRPVAELKSGAAHKRRRTTHLLARHGRCQGLFWTSGPNQHPRIPVSVVSCGMLLLHITAFVTRCISSNRRWGHLPFVNTHRHGWNFGA
jgi:hypothetical protein